MGTYTTSQGDEWDKIAFKLFPDLGGEHLMHRLMEANPEQIGTVIFPANVVLQVPEIKTPVEKSLPPWKR